MTTFNYRKKDSFNQNRKLGNLQVRVTHSTIKVLSSMVKNIISVVIVTQTFGKRGKLISYLEISLIDIMSCRAT